MQDGKCEKSKGCGRGKGGERGEWWGIGRVGDGEYARERDRKGEQIGNEGNRLS